MWHESVGLVAYHDLDGRPGFKLALQEVADRFFLYAAGFWHSGWSILEVTGPSTRSCSAFSMARRTPGPFRCRWRAAR